MVLTMVLTPPDPGVAGARVAHQGDPGSGDQTGVQHSLTVQLCQTGGQVGGNLVLLELLWNISS